MASNERRPIMAGNWKMHHTHLDAIQVVQKLSYRLEDRDYQECEVVVCPAFTALRSVQTVLEADRNGVRSSCRLQIDQFVNGEFRDGIIRPREGGMHRVLLRLGQDR